MSEHTRQSAQAQDAANRSYIQGVAGSNASPADEITRLADLRDKGLISDEDFAQGKAKALS